MSTSSHAELMLSTQLSVLALHLEERCRLPGGWPSDAKDDELFVNYLALYALTTAGRGASPQAKAAADKLRALREPSGLWKGAHADVEPTARATAALLMAETPPSTNLGAALNHILRHQLPDGGWALEGSTVVLKPHGEIGPTMPCVLALRTAYNTGVDGNIAAALDRARDFFDNQLKELGPKLGQSAKTDLAYAWAVRGRMQAGQTPPDNAAEHRERLEGVLTRIMSRKAPPDDIGFQVLFNSVHSMALLGNASGTTQTLDLNEVVTCMSSWALLLESSGQVLTRWQGGALLAGAALLRQRYPNATLVAASVIQSRFPGATEEAPSDPAAGFLASIWADFRRRTTTAKLSILGSTAAVAAVAASSVFGFGIAYAPRLDEPAKKASERLVGNLDVIVANKAGQPVPKARVEIRPVAPGQIVAETDAQGRAHLTWNLLDPAESAIRMEITAQPPQGAPAGRRVLPEKPANIETVYVP